MQLVTYAGHAVELYPCDKNRADHADARADENLHQIASA